MNVETRNISISFDSPDRMLNALRGVLEQTTGAMTIRGDRLSVPMRDGQHVVIIDSMSRRAQAIARLVAAAGYRPFLASSALDVYTAFLQGVILPGVVMLVSEDAADSLFLLRLQQRTLSRYHRNVPFIRIHIDAANSPHPSQLRTAPLALPSPAPAVRHISPERIVRPEIRSTQETPRPPFISPRPATIPQSTTRPLQLPPSMKNASAAPILPAPTEARGSLRRVRTEPLPAQPLSTPLPAIPRQTTAPMPAMATAPLLMPGMPGATTVPGGVEQATIVEIKEVEKRSLEGQNLGRYQIKNPLGGSPAGDVYIVYDRLREIEIAFKSMQGNVLPDGFLNDAYINTNLFQQEVDALANLKHPHILRVMSAGKSYISGTPFYYKTMPLCKEGSLAVWLYEHAVTGHFSLRNVLPVAMQLADALHYAHEHSVLYQNFKLANVLLEGEAGEDISRLHVLLADFVLTGDNKHVLRTPQTLRYLAPEQWGGDALPASDQYGLAALLYEMLTGRPPFQGNQEHLLRHMHLSMQPQPPSAFNASLSSRADSAILRALAKNPQERFSSVAEFARALRASV